MASENIITLPEWLEPDAQLRAKRIEWSLALVPCTGGRVADGCVTYEYNLCRQFPARYLIGSIYVKHFTSPWWFHHASLLVGGRVIANTRTLQASDAAFRLAELLRFEFFVDPPGMNASACRC